MFKQTIKICTEKKRAQINTLDFLIALVIFSLALIYAVTSLNESAQNALSETDYKYMMLSAMGVSETLVKNTGIPSEWNRSNVELIGLASSDREISEEKANEFCNLTQDDMRRLFRIPYYLHFSISGDKTITCGTNPNGKKAVTVRRRVLFNDKNGMLEITLWR